MSILATSILAMSILVSCLFSHLDGTILLATYMRTEGIESLVDVLVSSVNLIDIADLARALG